MVTLSRGGAWLLNGTEIVEEGQEAALQAKLGAVPSKEEAAQQTIAYGILKAHNTSDNMEKLKLKFDKLTSHDITFVGIIQTARASGLERFPIPYVLTNCHNSLCAVGGTINEDDHMFGLSCCQNATAASMCRRIRRSSISICQRDAGRLRQDDPRLRQPHPLRRAGYHGHWRGRRRAGKTVTLCRPTM